MAEEDIIFGKNRHFYGGIEPSNIVSFTANPYGDHIRLSITLPQDTIINGQTLCVVTGVVIRKSLTGYPKDEFDGDLLVDLPVGSNRTIMYTDADTEVTGTYFYAAFPYSAQGVYNRSYLNRYAYNEPADMVTFTAKSAYEYETDTYGINLVATLPENIVGAVIRKSAATYPVSETDGEEFMTITESGTYKDADVTADTMYFYAAFPYTSTGVYNRNSVNRASLIAGKYTWLYGYDLDQDDSNPSTRVTYPSDVMNSDYTPMFIASTSPTYGSWEDAGFMPKPCMLKYDGTVDYYLDPNDYTKREDGVTASDITSRSYEGGAMMEWPKIYTKRWEENGVYHFRCADNKIDKDWDCWCNYDKNDNVIDHFYMAIYPAPNQSSYKSTSMTNITPDARPYISGYKNFITEISEDWTIGVLADHLLIQDLLVLMGKHTNTQHVYGLGGNTSSTTGGLETKGLFYGGLTTRVKVFGIEDYWGGYYKRFIAGWYVWGETRKMKGSRVKITRGTHDGTSVTDYILSGDAVDDEYLTIGSTELNGGTSYIASMYTRPYGRLPKPNDDYSGSATTYECDVTVIDPGNSYTGGYARLGGRSDDVQNGAFYVDCKYPTTSTDYSVVYLSCKPTLKEA